ncbi:MAG: LysR family transcriptional regulator [Pseudobacteriovorax sp.]|nr:LysR family transcriptional regulator [Pseudobacteriovorax sp.]
MTLDQLEMVEAIISEGSFQAAAKKIHKSQPSLSAGIKKIEDYYSIQIFSRETYRPSLTDVGRRFYEGAKATLSSYRELHKLASELGAGNEPEIILSVDPMIPGTRYQRLMEIIVSNECKTPLKIQTGVLLDNAYRLLSGTADLAIGNFPQIDNHEIEHFKLCDIALIPVIHRRRLDNQALDKSLLSRTPNIVVQTVLKQASNHSDASHWQWFVDSHSRKTELISMGFGWGRVSEQELTELNDLTRLPEDMVPSMTIEMHLMRHKTKPLGPIARKLWLTFQNEVRTI